MIRENPFNEIYEQCNRGSNLEKYVSCKSKKGPICIDIELTNYCNLNCYMCPVGTNTMKRNKGYITMELIDKLCSEIKENLCSIGVKGVRLIRWGEPTLHPDFIEILRKLKESGIKVHFNTNGILLDEKMIRSIIGLEIDSIKFSFQGVDKISYEEMRKGSSWEKLFANVVQMYEIRGMKRKPFIQISTTTTYESENQIKTFRAEMAKYSDYCNVGKTKLSHLDVEKMDIDESSKAKYSELLAEESLHKKHMSFCPEVYDKLSLNWDGTVTACTSDYDNFLVVGNLYKNTLEEIFNNNEINNIRNKISEEKYEELNLCKNCYEYIKLKK